ncbi:MAG: lysophospholipid acyltransferase family protein [Proteobacteria bacterium]|nr:lysophospholipid acyltransferase family protein [Pseudomonadota bacterium]MBU4295968.1 lysophospholipid acyltransferase family protein [Pseudomonadota bacterium]MCG2746178.1 lysophospholipid acyltransferase family protein [Desulfobulbaceae bacterium]
MRSQESGDRSKEPEVDGQQKGLFYRFSLWVVPLLFRLLSFVLFSTCRVQWRDQERFTRLAGAGLPFIVSFWHYGVIYIVYQARKIPYVAMVSASKDGEYVSRILQSKGFATVRGSRNKGAIGALKGLMKEMDQGKTAVLVADGSQGPARKAQAGTILLASKTGAPILPVGWAADRYKSFRSWDRTAIPLPFSRVVLWFGEPISVPGKLQSVELEEYRILLEQALNDLYEKSWGEFGRKEH